MKILPNTPIVWKNYSPYDSLDPVNTHFFKISIDEYEKISTKYQVVLNDEELAKASRFIQMKDTKRYILGKFYLRIILSSLLRITSERIIFLYTSKKKPYVPGVEFNISHSGCFVVIVISSLPVGVDVEHIQNDFDYIPLLEGNFTATEQRKIEDITDFYTVWTRKEAILKATGEGLIDRLEEIDSRPDLVLRKGSSLRLMSSYLDKEHIMSSATDISSGTCIYWTLNNS